MTTLQKKPIVSFGALTDIQYANCDDAVASAPRYYRNGLVQIQRFIADMKSIEDRDGIQFKFILQLGDLLDQKTLPIESPHDAMSRVLAEFYAKDFHDGHNGIPSVLHIWGNHDMYNFSRVDLVQTPLNTARMLADCKDHSMKANYYALDLTDRFSLICLDFYERSCLGYDANDPIYLEALEFLRRYNQGEKLNSTLHLSGREVKYGDFNGSLSKTQFTWLSSQLLRCRNEKRKTIVCGHVPVHHKSAGADLLSWDNEAIVELLRSFNDVVKVYLAGHYHTGGYYQDRFGIHYVTLTAVLECEPDSRTYALVNVYDDEVSLVGVGKNPSLAFKLQND